jgi:hypothetical protein
MEFDERVFKKVIVKLTDRERENFKDCTHAVLDLLIFAHDVEGEMNFSALEDCRLIKLCWMFLIQFTKLAKLI